MSANSPFRSRPAHLLAFPSESLSSIDRWRPNFRSRDERYENKLRKASFFLIREGLSRTLRKRKARRWKEESKERGVCTIVREKESGLYYGGFQHHPEQEVYYFLPGACWEQEPSREELRPIEKLDPFLGYVPEGWEGDAPSTPFIPVHLQKKEKESSGKMDLYAIGCGGYMLSEVLPLFLSDLELQAAIDPDCNALDRPELEDAKHRSNDLQAVMEADEDPQKKKLAYIASYHSWHTPQALDFLRFPNGRTIIEKPPCLSERDLEDLCDAFDPKRVFIAFHRRYAPWNILVREWIQRSQEPILIDARIHETPIGPDHWYLAPNQGTRIAGNLCHWIDLAIYWIAAAPEKVTVAANRHLGVDHSFYAIHFNDGSMVHFTATDLGDGTKGVQERIELKSKEEEIRIEDYMRLDRWYRGKWERRRSIKRDKGHERMNRDYLQRILNEEASPYPKRDLIAVTRVQNAFIDLAKRGGGSMDLDLSHPSEKERTS